MNNDLQIFKNGAFNVRTITENDEIWFVARDVADALEYENSSKHTIGKIIANVPVIWKGRKRFPTPGGEQEMLCLNEQGLYFFLGLSDKPNALPYQMWIAGEVVPQIRATGFYATPKTAEKIISDPDTFIRILQELKAKQSEVKALQQQAEADKPKVIFADSVSASDNTILIRDLAKILRQNGYRTGEKRLYSELRNRGFLMKSGASYNMPTQKSMELGLMEVLERTIKKGDGEIISKCTPKITGKGQIYFTNLFLSK